MKKAVFLVAAIISCNVLFAQPREWRQSVRYEIAAELDTAKRRLNGDMKVFYKNNSPDTLSHIYLQVPANAFTDEENTAVREMRRFSGDNMDFQEDSGDELTIESLQFLSIGSRREFPLRAYDFSDTILDLPLPYPLVPGDTLTIGVHFFQDYARGDSTSDRRVPQNFIQWFPRMVVYDDEGWHAEPYHFMMQHSDVYAEFAAFDVRLRVPGNFLVVGSGTLVDEEPWWQFATADTSMDEEQFTAWHDSVKQSLQQFGSESGIREVHFRAENVHNFTWSASPEFVHYQFDYSYPIHIFYRGYEDKDWLEDLLTKIKKVLPFVEAHFGVYPFDQLSIVYSSYRHVMGFPMLAMLRDMDYFGLAYELSAVYIPGVVATNGVRDAWLANGLQVYMGKQMSELIYGKRGYEMDRAQEDMNWLERQYPLPTLDQIVRNLTQLYSESGQNEPIANDIHRYRDPLGMLANVYMKSEIFYEMLHYVVNDSVFKQSLREVFRQYSFNHVTGPEMKQIFEREHGDDLGWFFDQWLSRTPTVDYAKGKTRKRQKDDGTWVTEVDINRKGDGVMPVDIELDLGDGKTEIKRWDGKEETTTVVFETVEKPKAVNMDPEDRIMDSNVLNNRKPRLEFRPDLPFLKFIHMPNDAYLMLWSPRVDYNKYDGVRLGFRTRTSYRAFYHNLNLEAHFATKSNEFDAKAAYSHPLSRKSLMNRYHLLARKNEGRFELDAHIGLNGSDGIIGSNGRSLNFGLNYSGLLNSAYTFREVSSDTGKIRFQEWQDLDMLLGYIDGRTRIQTGALLSAGRIKADIAIPGSKRKFTKLSGRLAFNLKSAGMSFLARGNGATSFGPDQLPGQDFLRAEGAGPRERYQNNLMKTVDHIFAFNRRFVEGGGFLRGYAGQPLPAEHYVTSNFEFGPAGNIWIFKFFGFYDIGRVWPLDNSGSFIRSDAGLGVTLFDTGVNMFGGNLSFLGSTKFKFFFPFWLSDPLPGIENWKFRMYFTIGKAL